MTLLLVSIHVEESPRAVPLGPAMLAAALRNKLADRLQTEILNLTMDQSPSECVDLILGSSPQYVGFSVFVWNRKVTLEIAAELKRRAPTIIVFAGGPEASTDREGICENGGIDFVLAGECEERIVPVMENLLNGAVPHGDSEDAQPSFVSDLSALPSPFLDQTLRLNEYDGMLWELSRGCPFACDFCYESRGASGIRRFPIGRLREELRLFHDAGVEQVFVLDPTFNHDRETAKEVLRLIHEEAPEIYYFFEIRSESIDAELADLFAGLDCSLQIGLQSASNDVLKRINRTINTAEFESNVLLLHQAGAVYGFDLIYGLPGDTLAGFYASLDFAMSLAPNHVDMFPLAVLPGTRLREKAAALELDHQPDAPYRVLSSPQFSSEEMALASEVASAFDLFYNKGRAVPWFAIMVDAIERSPSAFVRQFAGWLKGRSVDDIVSLQIDFVRDVFAQYGKRELTELAIDIITYFGRFELVCDEKTAVSFGHNPIDLLDLLEHGVTDLETLAQRLPQSPCTASLRFHDGDATIQINEPPSYANGR